MSRQVTIAGAICAGGLFLFTLGTANAADQATTDRKNEYKAAIAHADADYAAAKEGCRAREGNDRDVCMKQAKADHVRATADAKARLKSKDATAEAREDTMDAQYKVAKEKCDAFSGDARDSCIKDAKLRYHE